MRTLLYKLDHVGIRDALNQWIKSFLTDRHFRVRVDDFLSRDRPVRSGISQGLVLEPL